MKIILNGATSGTNFGDYLFAEMFQERIGKLVGSENVFWYTSRFAMSDFYRKNLKNYNTYRLGDMDALVYISGGYFCGQDNGVKDYIKRYLRYFKVGMQCLRRRIPHAIIGMEVGVSHSKILQHIQKKLLKRSDLLIVRNAESLEVLKKIGINHAVCTADSVFAMERSLFENKELPKEIATCEKKILLFHIYPHPARNASVKEKIVPIVNEFIKSHPEYTVLITSDQCSPTLESELREISDMIEGDKLTYLYDDPIALCKVIDRADLVVTPKLHVGIVGARLGKSVVSFCDHAEKVLRLYAQLGEDGRTCALRELDTERGVAMLEKYHETPITVPESITALARSNFELLDKFILKISDGSVK